MNEISAHKIPPKTQRFHTASPSFLVHVLYTYLISIHISIYIYIYVYIMSGIGHVHCHVWAIRIYHHHLKKWHFSFNWSSNPVTFHNFPPWPSKNLSKYWDKSFANRLYTWLTVRQFIELLGRISHESYKLLWAIMNHHPIHYSIAVQHGNSSFWEGDTLFYQSHCMLTVPSNKWGSKQPCQHE